MLKATVITPQQAEHYYRQENYYSKKESIANSQWSGKGAEELGLSGNVDEESFSNLLYGKLPNEEKFRNRPPTNAKYKERAGIDLTFSAPKSVSLAVLVNGDRQLEQAHKEAVEVSLKIAEERYAQTRIRNRDTGTRETISTGNLIIGQFHHDTSRELDPQVHTHAVVLNATQSSEGRWYSLNNDEIFRRQKLLGQIYQNELAIRAQKLGYEIEQKDNGQFELKGYSEEHLEHYSKRRKQIKEILKEIEEIRGKKITKKQIEYAALKTRKPKGKEIAREELQKYWREEGKIIGLKHPQLNKRYQKKAADSGVAIAEAIEHSSERKINFKREDLEKFVLAETGTYSWHDLQQSINNNQDLLKAKEGQLTTMFALNRELDTIKIINDGNNSVSAIASELAIKEQLPDELTKGQKEAVAMAATTSDRYTAWQGKAGAGKTFALSEFQRIAEEKGYAIRGYAPSAEAAKNLEEELNIETATVARKLISEPLDKESQQQQIWIVDEAGLLSAKDTHELLKKAEKEEARILFVGDTKQLSSVEAGNPFKSLQKAGIQTAYLEQSLRQKNAELKVAIDKISDGRIADGIKALDDSGRIEEAENRAERIADDYLKLSPNERKKTLILAGTNAEREEIVGEIRTRLKAEGSLGQDFQATHLKSKDITKIQAKYARHYQLGDTIVGIRNFKYLKKDTLYSVVGIDLQKNKLTLKSDKGNTIEIDPSKISDKAVYEAKRINISEGDRLKWTKNDAELDRRNGQEFFIIKLRDNTATIKYDNSSRIEKIDLSTPQNYDHVLVSTTYSSQGKTANRVMVSATSDKTLSKESFYVAASRTKYNLTVYAQDKEQLIARAQKSQANLNPLEILEKHEEIKNRVDENLKEILDKYIKNNQLKAQTQQQKAAEKIDLSQNLEQERSMGIRL